MRIGFLGFGLIGGSMARALRTNAASSSWHLAAWSPSGEGPRRAAGDGVIDDAPDDPGGVLAAADVVVLAGPATACLDLLSELAARWRPLVGRDTVVTDVASTKVALVERADALGIRYVGGHPMAGFETAGYDAATDDLFAGRPWVVVPGAVATTDDVGRIDRLVEACGARVLAMTAAEHDRAVAAISHLPLVVAAALVEAVIGEPGSERSDWPAAAALAAGGWASATRVARGDPVMGAAIAATNAAPIAARVRDLQAVLDAWLAELESPAGPDEAAIARRLATARAALERSG